MSIAFFIFIRIVQIFFSVLYTFHKTGYFTGYTIEIPGFL